MFLTVYLLFIICLLRRYSFETNNDIDFNSAEKQYNAYCARHFTNLPCNTRCQRGRKCGNSKSEYSELSDSTRQYIVSLANRVRSIVAQGENKANFPPASNMRVVSYDKECEFFAGCYLKSCVTMDTFVKIALDGNHLGATGYGIVSFNATVDRIGEPEIQSAFMGWYLSSLGPTKALSYNKDAYTDAMLRDTQANYANDFLQLGAANTTKIGCAKYVRLLSSNLLFYQFYCIYNPAIKFGKDFMMYKPGLPTSACSDWGEKANKLYPDLCGEIRPIEKDLFQGFMDLNGAGILKLGMEMIFLEFILMFKQA